MISEILFNGSIIFSSMVIILFFVHWLNWWFFHSLLMSTISKCNFSHIPIGLHSNLFWYRNMRTKQLKVRDRKICNIWQNQINKYYLRQEISISEDICLPRLFVFSGLSLLHNKWMFWCKYICRTITLSRWWR